MEGAKGCSLEAGEAKGTLLPCCLQKDLAQQSPGFCPVRLIPRLGPEELGDGVCVRCAQELSWWKYVAVGKWPTLEKEINNVHGNVNYMQMKCITVTKDVL